MNIDGLISLAFLVVIGILLAVIYDTNKVKLARTLLIIVFVLLSVGIVVSLFQMLNISIVVFKRLN